MHKVQFVGDTTFPPGHDFMVLADSRRVIVALRESALSPRLLEDAWSAYRVLAEALPPERISLLRASG